MENEAEKQDIDESEDVEEVTDTAEESQEDTTEVTDDSEDQDDSSTDESDESEDSTEDETDDEREFLRQYDLPEDVDTIEKAMEYLKNLKDGLLPGEKRGQTEAQKKLDAIDGVLRQAGYVNGVDDLVRGNIPQGAASSQNAGVDDPFKYTSDYIKNNLSQGKYSEEDAKYLNPISEMIDTVLKEHVELFRAGFREVYNELQGLKGATTNLSSFTRDREYADFVKLGKQQKLPILPKDKLDAVMKEMPKLNTYKKAQAYLLATDDKELGKLFSNIQKGAETTAFKKFKRGGKFLKSKGQKGGSTLNYKAFLNPDGTVNQEKVLSHPNADKILDHFSQ